MCCLCNYICKRLGVEVLSDKEYKSQIHSVLYGWQGTLLKEITYLPRKVNHGVPGEEINRQTNKQTNKQKKLGEKTKKKNKATTTKRLSEKMIFGKKCPLSQLLPGVCKRGDKFNGRNYTRGGSSVSGGLVLHISNCN